MDLINNIRAYIDESEPKITVLKNKINISNYNDIGHFESDKIVVKCDDMSVIISGKDLVVSKLVNDEILITGKYSNIEFR